jgi:polysaccharide deacetylase family protein (PEP-CTERM system associated)
MFESRVVPATCYQLEILREYQVRATFFVLGQVADQSPNLIEQIRTEGHEIGLHGYYHRFVNRMSRDEFAAEIDRSLRAVERITGELPLGHRAPYFSVDASTPWVFEVLQRYGLLYDSSVFPTRNMLYGFPDAPRFPYRPANSILTEFPLTTVRYGGINWPLAGGFYLRALPYAVMRWGIRQVNRLGQPAVIYLHPWELDVEQRYQQVTPRERITHYYGRRRLAAKLHQLFSDFRFGPLQQLLEQPQLKREAA